MKIVHIITGLNNGGAEAVLYRLCTTDMHNHHSVISLMDDGKYGRLLKHAGIAAHYLRMPQGRLTLRGVTRLSRVLRQTRPDVVQTWMYHADLVGGLVSKVSGVGPICWNIRHSDLAPEKVKRSTLLTARVCTSLAHWVPKLIVCCSPEAARVHEELGYPRDKLRVITNGYDLEALGPSASARERVRADLGLGVETPLIGMVARFDPQKDHASLFDALRRVKDSGVPFRCAVVGTGMVASNSDVEALLSRYGIAGSVLLLGARDDVPALMNAFDLHVLSSAYGEGFPNVVAESMACGTPAVATDVGAAKLIVGETGWIVPPSNPGALGQAICTALSALEDRASWAGRQLACRTRIEQNFGIEKMVESYTAVWREAVATKT